MAQPPLTPVRAACSLRARRGWHRVGPHRRRRQPSSPHEFGYPSPMSPDGSHESREPPVSCANDQNTQPQLRMRDNNPHGDIGAHRMPDRQMFKRDRSRPVGPRARTGAGAVESGPASLPRCQPIWVCSPTRSPPAAAQPARDTDLSAPLPRRGSGSVRRGQHDEDHPTAPGRWGAITRSSR